MDVGVEARTTDGTVVDPFPASCVPPLPFHQLHLITAHPFVKPEQ